MRRFFIMAVLFLGVTLLAAPLSYGETRTFTWTGNKLTDPSVFPEFSVGWPLDTTNTNPLPNTDGRIGGTPIHYGNQVLCGQEEVYHGVSTGGCNEVGGKMVCDKVNVASYTAVGGKVTVIDPFFEDATCALADPIPTDDIPDLNLFCDNFIVPDECVLKDVIGFQPLGRFQGMVDIDEEQSIWLPEPPGIETVSRGDFILTAKMAMTDMKNRGGWFWNGVVMQAKGTNYRWELSWRNYGGTPETYLNFERVGVHLAFNKDSLGWDPLLHAPNGGNVEMRLARIGQFITASFRAPGGVWTEMDTFDLSTRSEVDLDGVGYYLGIVNKGEPDKILWIDELTVVLTVDPTPVIALEKEIYEYPGYGTRFVTFPAYWIERGTSYYNPGATAREFDENLAPIDVTDQMEITSWARRRPDIVMPGEEAVDVNYPDEYVVAYNYTDTAGRPAKEVQRRYVVYDEGSDWAEYNGHWYKMNTRKSYLDHRADAISMGGYVTAITDRAENDWMLDEFMARVLQASTDYAYSGAFIGLTDLIVTSDYKWDSGEPLDFINWVNDEPNNWEDQGWGPEHYGFMSFGPEVGWVQLGFWVDMDDDACCPIPNWGDWLNETTRYRPAIIEVERDPLPPVITLTGPKAKSIGLGGEYVEEGATAFDNLDGDMSDKVVITSALDTNAPDEYTISYDATDVAGNNANTVTRTVFVTFGSDERPPLITAEGCDGTADVCMNELGIGDAYTAAGTTVFDDYDLENVDVVAVTYSLAAISADVNWAGNITFASCFEGAGCLKETDLANAEAGDGGVVIAGMEVMYAVLVESAASPNQTLVWQQVREVVFDAGDAVAAIDTNMSGVYVTRYDAEDAAGNVADAVDRLVIVKDNPPVLVLNGMNMYIAGGVEDGLRVGTPYEELGATASDVEDDDEVLTAAIVMGGDEVDSDTVGEYTVTYDVTDSGGNAAIQQIRTVRVFEPAVQQKTEKAPETVSDFVDNSVCFIGTVSPR